MSLCMTSVGPVERNTDLIIIYVECKMIELGRYIGRVNS